MVTDDIRCASCANADAEFTVDWPADGFDVCGACLPDALRDTAKHGHEWAQVFEGQYPRYLKVTPIVEAQ